MQHYSLVLYCEDDLLAQTVKGRAETYLNTLPALRDRGFDLQVFCIGDSKTTFDSFDVKETRMTTRVCAKVVSFDNLRAGSYGYDLRFRSSMRKEYGWVGNLGTIDPAYSQPLLADVYCIRTSSPRSYTSLHGARVCQIVACGGDGRGFDDVVVYGPSEREEWLKLLRILGQSEEARGGFGSTGI